jgi:O-antigen ligase
LALSASNEIAAAAGECNPLVAGTDHNFQTRLEVWRAAVALIGGAPWLGLGPTLPIGSVDNVYLEWILYGGVIGLALWLAGLALLAPRSAWPVLAAALAIGLLANPFAVGPIEAIVMVAFGLLASRPPEAGAGVSRGPWADAAGSPETTAAV